jgi:putative membrane protein
VPWTLAFLVITVGGGFAVELLGSRTGWPFGTYDYTDVLQPQVLGVPVIIPLAWAMMAYPALVVARRLTANPWLVPVIGAWALASWDLFLDPMMVAERYWTWTGNTVEIPGLDGIPATNLIGWAGAAFVMMVLLDRLGHRKADDRQPALLYLWTYASSVMAAAVFFGTPAVAVVGAIGMGLVAWPFAWALWRDRW